MNPKVGTPGGIRAIDSMTGEIRWNFELEVGAPAAGVLGTAAGIVFAGSDEGYLIALDAKTGKALWRYQTGDKIRSSPISYSIDCQQRIALSTNSSLVTFGLH
jgi:alcohol dehydrogenase (cytochrome c)